MSDDNQLRDQRERESRDLLIRLETKFDAMASSFVEFEKRIEAKFTAKADHIMLQDKVNRLEDQVKSEYVLKLEAKPALDAYQEMASRIRNTLIGGAIVLLIMVASVPFFFKMWTSYQDLNANQQRLIEQIQPVTPSKDSDPYIKIPSSTRS